MKHAIILHGTACTPESFWYPSIKKYLEGKGYTVWVPALPRPDTPDLMVQVPFVMKGGKFTKDTIIIGHSAGCPLTLSVLEQIKTKIRMVVLVAGYARVKGREKKPERILQDSYAWDTITQNTQDIVFINSDDDPWGCDQLEGMYMFEHLGGTLIVRHGEGHMGSDKYHQPYKRFPMLEKILDLA